MELSKPRRRIACNWVGEPVVRALADADKQPDYQSAPDTCQPEKLRPPFRGRSMIRRRIDGDRQVFRHVCPEVGVEERRGPCL